MFKGILRVNNLFTVLVGFCLVGAGPTAVAQSIDTAHFKKVVWVVFENTNYKNALAQPDFANLTKSGVLLTRLTASTHPSQGNYLAMIAGTTFGVVHDLPIDLGDRHIGDLLEERGLTWKVYAENYPGNCFLGKTSGNYVRKHVPFLSFTNVTTNPERCANVENEAKFMTDLAGDKLPEFSMYIPNQQNNGHDTNVSFSGRWLKSKFGALLASPEKLGETLFIVTFDESGGGLSNQVFTVLIGAHVKKGVQFDRTLSHPSLLRMIEDEFDLGSLGQGDATANLIEGIWLN
jgi:hypothetical protein